MQNFSRNVLHTMEKSEQFYRRQELMKQLKVPLMRDVKKELGQNLANVVFQECPEALKEELGLKPSLRGAGKTLWTSPSDLLIGKVCLKPPLTDRYIKALTHQGILDIGRDIDRRYWLQIEEERKQALKEQAGYLNTLANREHRIHVKHAREEERADCERRINLLTLEFEERLKAELEALEKYMLELQEEAVELTKAAVAEEWQLKLDKAVEETTLRLTKEFLEDLEKQKERLSEAFRKELEQEQVQFDHAFKAQQDFCRETLKKLKHCLECKNISNLMYVLCMERRKCDIERTALDRSFKLEVQALERKIEKRDKEIEKLLREKDNKQRQVNVREECLLCILKQFQKFINFALRAVPTQAEFLLNVEKMMLFELTEALIKAAPKRGKRLARTILPWKSESDVTGSSRASLTAKDFHNCNNENRAPNAEESDVMPAIFYEDRPYVREDFRHMFLNGIEMSESNMLWNKDVEHLMKILKSTVTVVQEEDEGVSHVTEDIEKEIAAEKSLSLTKEKSSPKESKQFHTSYTSVTSGPKRKKSAPPRKSMLKASDEKIKQPHDYCATEGASRSTVVYDEMQQIIKELAGVEVIPIDTTGILAARDSLLKVRKEIHASSDPQLEKGSPTTSESQFAHERMSHKISVPGVSFEDLEVIQMPDQIVLSRPSYRASRSSWTRAVSKPETATQVEPILVQKQASTKSFESRLVSVKDSLLIHRQSLAISLHKPPPILAKQTSKESRLSMHVDSLELIRRASLHSKLKEDCFIPDALELSRTPSKQSIVGEAGAVKKHVSPLAISRMEVANVPARYKDAVVDFCPLREVYDTQEIDLSTKDSPWKIYECEIEEKVPSRDSFLTKPAEEKIVGDQSATQGYQSTEDFTTDRIHSILEILRQDSSLLRLFTSCTK